MREPRDSANYHDPEWPRAAFPVDVNRVQADLEDIADRELDSAHPTFRDWLMDQEPRFVAAFAACAAVSLGKPLDIERRAMALQALGRLRDDYRQWRLADAKRNGEWDQIALTTVTP